MKKNIIVLILTALLIPFVYADPNQVYCKYNVTCSRSDFLSCNVLYPWLTPHAGTPTYDFKGTYYLHNINNGAQNQTMQCYYISDTRGGFTVSDITGDLVADQSNPNNKWTFGGSMCQGANYLLCPLKFKS